MMRTTFAEGALSASMEGQREVRVESVVVPKLSDRVVMPDSYWRQRVSAYIVGQPVSPFSWTCGMPETPS